MNVNLLFIGSIRGIKQISIKWSDGSKLKVIKLYNVTYNGRLLISFLSEFTTKFKMVAGVILNRNDEGLAAKA